MTAAYAAVTGGLATVLVFRLIRWILADRLSHADLIAFALSVPFIFLGVYSIFPHPFYGAEASWSALVALAVLVRAYERSSRPLWLLAGALLAVPLFAKQNISRWSSSGSERSGSCSRAGRNDGTVASRWPSWWARSSRSRC